MSEESKDTSMVLEGCLVGVLLVILSLGAVFLLDVYLRGNDIIGFGVIQAVLAVPVVMAFLRHRRRKAAIGTILSASLVFLLSAACWGMMGSLTNMH